MHLSGLILLISLAFLSFCYAALLFYLWTALLKRKAIPAQHNSERLPFVSVVIPMHNEEVFVADTLRALSLQDYGGEWEALFVNDRSTDSSPSIVEEFCVKNSRFKQLHIPIDSPKTASPKKRALNEGILAAKGEVILTADADCRPPGNWISSMAAYFAVGADVVQGAKANTGTKSFLHAYQRLETLGWTLIEAAGYNRGKPIVASGASLGYRRDLFFKCGGFEGLMGLTSGDDDMLIHKMAKVPKTKFAYNWDSSAVMPTAPVDSWFALLQQRARWGSNGAKYENKPYSIFLFCIYGFFLYLFIAPWLIPLGLPVIYFALSFAMKCLLDFLLLFTGALKLKSCRLLWCLPFVELVQIPIFTFAVPLGHFGLYKWK